MDLNAALGRAVELGASDIHLKVGQPPVLRRDGELGLLPDHAPLYESDLQVVLAAVADLAPAKLSHFHETGELDIAYAAEGLPRFRVNGYRQRGSISFAFRVIPSTARERMAAVPISFTDIARNISPNPGSSLWMSDLTVSTLMSFLLTPVPPIVTIRSASFSASRAADRIFFSSLGTILCNTTVWPNFWKISNAA